MNRLAFYMHAGSGNHGCEAIVDSLVRSLPEEKITLMTNSAKEDEKYLPEDVKRRLDIIEEQHIDRHFFTHALYYARRKITKDEESFLRYRYRALTGNEKPDTVVSIGGDNYCYDIMVPDLMLANAMFHHQGTKTVLLGCSIEPKLLSKDRKMREDIASYEKVIARESITYSALLENGIPKEKVALVPDPAFLLPTSQKAVPGNFKKGQTVGINVSPMVLSYAKDSGAVLESFKGLVRYILTDTDMDIALIPHVVWERSDDLVPLKTLYEEFKDTGRVRLFGDLPAEELKGIIASCRFFIGARTHATIAAYSSLVPTLVIGYSVKAAGIAKDLFGTSTGYVLPVQGLTDKEQVTAAFKELTAKEEDIRHTLEDVIPSWKKRAEQNAEEIRKVLAQ